MYKLREYLKPYKKELVLGPLFKLLEAIFELMIPTLMVLIIDRGIGSADKAYVVKIGSLMLIIATVGLLSAYLCQYYASKASQGFGTELRNGLFKHISEFSYEDIDKIGTPSLINRIINDVNQLQIAVAMLIRLVVRAPFLCIGGLIMAMSLDFKLSIVILILLPIFIIFLYLIMYKSIPLYKSVQAKLDRLGQVLRENLMGVRVIRGYAKVEYEESRFRESNGGLTDDLIKVGKIASFLNPMTSLLTNMAILAVIYYGGFRINIGEMTQGQVIAFINYINLIVIALVVVANLVILFTRAYASATRVVDILNMEPSIVDRENINKLDLVEDGSILEFKNVDFTYAGGSKPSLKNISFKLERGKTLGIIGVTGSGKTSLLNLIPRFYEPSKGKVYVNGIDVASYPQTYLRDKIGLVPQKSILFSGSILDNIKWGKAEASMEEVKLAAEISQSKEFIEALADGYQGRVDQGGVNLSGGQRQRIAIARAIIKRPEILILDDSLSALDYETDVNLRKALKKNEISGSTIIVSQRVSAIKNADKILVMDNGKIVGQGSHKDLMETCKTYQDIYHSQVDGTKEGQDER